LRDNLAHVGNLSPDERVRLDKNMERWQAMSPEEREQMRERWRKFRALTPDERDQILRAHEAKQQ
jgi:hypothetical protein